MKILANDGISDEGKNALEKAGYTVITDKVNQEDLIQAVNDNNYEVVLVRSATTIRKEVIDACPNLKLIGRGGVGMDNIDVAYARENSRIVINTPASSSQSVAELVMGHLFSISRFLNDSFKNIETGDFNALKKKYAKGIELRGKTLGIIGFGRIGQSLASYALGCGMNVLAVDQYEMEVEIPVSLGNNFNLNIPIKTVTDLYAILSECDFISIHVPKQADGSAVLAEKEFAQMKKGVRLVNAARGGVIDEKALITALDSGKVAYAALDVFENEPNPSKELLAHSKIACTPHIGAATLEAQDRIGLELAELIVKEFGVYTSIQA
jgi:D-3-phosphoglycerate dehydrogenase